MNKKIKNVCISDLVMIIAILLPLLIVAFDFGFTALSYKGSAEHLELGEFTQAFINQFTNFHFLNIDNINTWLINNLGIPNNSIFLCAFYILMYYVFVYLLHFIIDIIMIIPYVCENFLERFKR